MLQGAVFVSGIAVAFDALLHEPPALPRPSGAVESADFAAAAAVAVGAETSRNLRTRSHLQLQSLA